MNKHIAGCRGRIQAPVRPPGRRLPPISKVEEIWKATSEAKLSLATRRG